MKLKGCVKSNDNELARYLASYLKERENWIIEDGNKLSMTELYRLIVKFYDNLP